MNEPNFEFPETALREMQVLTKMQQDYIIAAVKLNALVYAWEMHQYLYSLTNKQTI